MNARDAVRAAFMVLGERPVYVKELKGMLPQKMKREFISKECVLLARLGLLSAEMVNNEHHGRRYRFTATSHLLATPAVKTLEEGIERALQMAREPIDRKDLRYALRSLWKLAPSPNEFKRVLEGMEREGAVAKEGMTYRWERGAAAGWKVLSSAVAGMSVSRPVVFSSSTQREPRAQ